MFLFNKPDLNKYQAANRENQLRSTIGNDINHEVPQYFSGQQPPRNPLRVDDIEGAAAYQPNFTKPARRTLAVDDIAGSSPTRSIRTINRPYNPMNAGEYNESSKIIEAVK
jgi:hypothetical protein